MKLWKKLMVFATAMLLLTAIMAAHFIGVSVEAGIQVNTEHAGIQIAAHDGAIDPETDHQYILERTDADTFKLNLGVWGVHSTFRTTRAFLLANAGPGDIQIVNVSVSEGLADNIYIYLADGQQQEEFAADNQVLIWNGTSLFGDLLDMYPLATVDDPYEQTGYLKVVEDDGVIGSAAWVDSQTGDQNTDGDDNDECLYAYTPALWDAAAYTSEDPHPNGVFNWQLDEASPVASGVWIYISIEDAAEVTGTISFDIRDL